MTELYLISGFLGAGKTTLLQKLLRESFSDKRVALVENDFGAVSLDAALLRDGGYTVQEIRAGCICCTLNGNFVRALSTMLRKIYPDIVLIEPSGVAKLSDVETLCRDRRLNGLAELRQKITVVDAAHCESYCENFGAFFKDQVCRADTIVFSHSENKTQQLAVAQHLVNKLNPDAAVFAGDWRIISADEILRKKQPAEQLSPASLVRHAPQKQTFSSVTVPFTHPIDLRRLAVQLAKLCKPEYGTILRAKGVLQSEKGVVLLQYVCGEWTMEQTTLPGNEICIIGDFSNEQNIAELFASV